MGKFAFKSWGVNFRLTFRHNGVPTACRALVCADLIYLCVVASLLSHAPIWQVPT